MISNIIYENIKYETIIIIVQWVLWSNINGIVIIIIHYYEWLTVLFWQKLVTMEFCL